MSVLCPEVRRDVQPLSKSYSSRVSRERGVRYRDWLDGARWSFVGSSENRSEHNVKESAAAKSRGRHRGKALRRLLALSYISTNARRSGGVLYNAALCHAYKCKRSRPKRLSKYPSSGLFPWIRQRMEAHFSESPIRAVLADGPGTGNRQRRWAYAHHAPTQAHAVRLDG